MIFTMIRSSHFVIMQIIFGMLLLSSCEDNLQESIIEPNECGVDFSLVNIELKIINYLGNTENIHPKVLYFENGWNGYPFWMAYTPYPKGDTNAENPCIAVSNDGINWGVRLNMINPLADTPAHGYNSDTHLVYDSDNDVLECWWREVDNSGNDIDAFYRRVTKDGVSWSPKEIVYDFDQENRYRLSPAVSLVDGRYYMVISDCAKLYYQWGDSLPSGGIEWEEPHLLDVPFSDNVLNLWHQDMIIDENHNAEMIVCAYDKSKNENNNSADLYMLQYNIDNPTSVTEPILIRKRNPDTYSIANRSIYRSSLVKVEGLYFVYISCIDKNWHRHMMLSTGESLFDLVDSSL